MAFRRIGKIAEAVIKQIDCYKKKDLLLLIRECKRMTEINCGWLEYELKDIVIDCAKMRIHTLNLQKKEAKQ